MADGFLFGACSKCCDACECDCESPFGIFVNGREATGFELIAPFGGVQFLPGVTINAATERLATHAFVDTIDDVRCDDDGNLIAKITIQINARLTKQDDFGNEYQGEAFWSREYRFDLSDNACRIITGTAVGDVTGSVVPSDPFEPALDPDDFQVDWDSLDIKAWCNKNCGGGGPLTFSDCTEPSCQESQCICEQPLDDQGFPLEGFDFFTGSFPLFYCLLNPLP
jgi:hypothetical protein